MPEIPVPPDNLLDNSSSDFSISESVTEQLIHLRQAIRNNNTEQLKELIKIPAVRHELSFDASDEFEVICETGNVEALELLLEIEGTEKQLTDYRSMPLYRACQWGHAPLVARLLQVEVIREGLSISGFLAYLNCAAANNNLEVLNLLLEEPYGKAAIARTNCAALVNAAEQGHIDIVNRLLELEEVVNYITVEDNLAFRQACKKGNLDVVKRLLQYDQVVTEIAAYQNNAFTTACRYGHLEIVNILLEYQDVVGNIMVDCGEAICNACENGHLDITRRLLEYPEVLGGFDEEGIYPLIRACGNGHLEIVNLLLEYEEVRRHVADHGCLAFQYACVSGNIDIVRRLLEFVEIAAQVDVQHNAPLRAACDSGCYEIVELLLQYPAVTNQLTANHNEAYRAAHDQIEEWNENCPYRRIADRLREFDAVANFERDNPPPENNLELADVYNFEENAMRALNKNQEALVKVVQEYYSIEFESRGVEDILSSYKEYLEIQYNKNPVADKDGKPLPLKLNKELFDSLDVETKQKYYGNIYHTAWRYLFDQPNILMHPHALYVNVSESGVRTAAVDKKDIDLIAYFWLAASDTNIIPLNNATVEDMQELFTVQIAMIARTHNWDFDYDDKVKDKPSCPMGVRQRVIQSVIDNPITQLPESRSLSEDIVFQKVRESLITDNFRGYLSSKSISECVDLLDKAEEMMIMLSEPDDELLEFQVCDELINGFMQHCKDWFGEDRFIEETKCSYHNQEFEGYENLVKALVGEPWSYYYDTLVALTRARIKELEVPNNPLEGIMDNQESVDTLLLKLGLDQTLCERVKETENKILFEQHCREELLKDMNFEENYNYPVSAQPQLLKV
jgi:ankyrin repeat protein